MNMLQLVRTLGPVDARNIRRDALLVAIPFTPLLLALLIRFGLPPLESWLLDEFAFDLSAYHPLVMSLFLMLVPALAGMVAGLLLLDERDMGVLTALNVTPLGPDQYLLYRLSLPVLAGFVLTLIAYPIAGLMPLPAGTVALIAVLAALTGPQIALFLAAFAENKVVGLTLVKLINGVQMLPMVAYFIDPPAQYLAGVLPGYWPLKAFWLAADGESLVAALVIGVVVNMLVTAVLLRRFRALPR